MANLAAKYRPKTLDDVVEQSLVVDMVRSLCNSSNLEVRNFLFVGPAGCGKAQPLYSKVLTPDGFIPMRDVTVGTTVFTDKGNRAKVSGVFPQGKRKIFEIELQDRSKIRVADNHLNVVWRYNEDTKQREDFVITTEDLIELFQTSRFNLRIDIPEVDWYEIDVPIDPYLVGALIGDGSLHDNFHFSNSEADVVNKVDSILRRDWDCQLTKLPGDNVDYSISSIDRRKFIFTYRGNEYSCPQIIDVLESEGYPKFDLDTLIQICIGSDRNCCRMYPELQKSISVRHNLNYDSVAKLRAVIHSLHLDTPAARKHIPDIYLRNSKRVREQLLQGLFDTDGYSSGLTTEFATSSAALSRDFEFLVRSLGARVTVSKYNASYINDSDNKVQSNTSYKHTFKFTNGVQYCSSAKHLLKMPKYQNSAMRNIVDIRYIGREECQCIMVDHEDHTYISDGFIPTHNTTTARIIANMINNGKGEPIEIDAASHSGVDAMREIVSQARTYPVGCDWKVFIVDEVHAISPQGWQTLLKTLEEGPAKTVFLMATTNPEKIPATILSRVQTFQLSKISLEGIEDRLKYIISEENKSGNNITYEDAAISFIAKMGKGGMRDSITLLEKALAYDANITSKSVVTALGLPNYDDFFALLQAYAKKDNQAIADIIDRVYNSGINFVKWMSEFHAFVINVVKYIFLQDITKTTIPAHYQDKISKYSTAHSTICLKLANKLVKLNQELKTTQYLQELTLTYLCSPSPKK